MLLLGTLCAGLIALPVAHAAQAEISGLVRVIDGDTLDVGGKRIRLFGIDSVERDQTCRHPSRGTWPCGREVTREVATWLDGKTLRCTREDTDRYGRIVATCHLGGTDVGEALVSAGLAFAYKTYSTRYVPQEARALSAGRGLWTSVVLRPEAFRSQKRARVQPVVPTRAGCTIKGNIASSGERIFHVEGQRDYARTAISLQKGERWFCTEAEARRAGWRKAHR
ncbi:thermonuclease family protein [Marinovum sp.]|uniref:thermonuclease family protein n=1 Tax=Marinovum sp. TaxID=2024839 RepID=UPI002B2786C6|nr:thermonuclease family protein [Marinovum sp.]